MENHQKHDSGFDHTPNSQSLNKGTEIYFKFFSKFLIYKNIMPKDPNECPGPTPKMSLSELKDLGLNKTMDNPYGCGRVNESGTFNDLVKYGWGYPDNGEFEYGGAGSKCNICWWDWGCECPDKKDWADGKRGKVKRVAYKAPENKCCETGNQLIDGKTCDPKYKDPTSSACRTSMESYCAKDNNITKPRCREALFNTDNGKLIESATKHCEVGGPERNEFCMEFCSKKSKESVCNSAATAYCQRNPTNTDYCGCINTQQHAKILKRLEENGLSTLPHCMLQQCATNPNAYKPFGRESCPSQNTCVQGINVDDVGGSTALADNTFSCEIDATTTNQITNTSTETNTNNETNTNTDENDDQFTKTPTTSLIPGIPNMYLWIGIALLVVLLVLRR